MKDKKEGWMDEGGRGMEEKEEGWRDGKGRG